MRYRIEPNWIYLDIDEETAKEMAAVKNDKSGMYRLPNTIGAMREIVSLLEQTPIVEGEPDPNDQRLHLASEVFKKVKQRGGFLRLKTFGDIIGDERLRPYQRVDVNYLKRLPHMGIFNEQRTGKTPTAISAIAAKGITDGLVICPAGLCLQWKEELEKWLDYSVTVEVLSGKTKKQRHTLINDFSNGFIVTSYESAVNDLNELIKNEYDVLLLDEAHRLRSVVKGKRKNMDQKGKMSKQAEVCLALGRKAKCRMALTGTPTVKAPYEIYGILKFLYPDKFPGFWQFAARYFEVGQDFLGNWFIGEPIRKEELQDVVSLISTNRKRKEVMPWLPKKQYQTIKLEMSDKQRKAYKDVSDVFEYEEDGELLVDAPSILAQVTRLRQITTCPQILDIEDVGAKERFLLEWIKDNPDEPVIIFSSFTQYLGRLCSILNQKGFGKYGIIHGGQPMNVRKNIQNDFQAGKFNILLANIQACKEGLTLDRAETSIFIDKSYLPSDNDQASDRMVPVSQERNHSMSVITLTCKDTIDEAIEGLLKQRKSLIDIVNNGGREALRRILK